MTKLKSTIARALDIRPGDGWPLVLLLIHSFFYGISFIYIETPANTLFLAMFSVKTLSYVYILTAVIATLVGLGYAKLESRLRPERLLPLTLLALSVAAGLVYAALMVHESRWLAMLLMVWKDVQWMLSGVEFWALAGLLFNVRQGKRLFGLVSAGEVIASILGGLSVPYIVRHLGGPRTLVLLSALAMAASLGVLVYTLRRFASRFEPEAGHAEEKDTRPLPALFKERFLFLFFALSVLAYVTFYFIDYVFYDRVEQAFPDEMKLASFFGVFFAVLGGVELLGKTFLTGRMLTRYGLGFGLLALPVVDFVTTGAAVGTGWVFGMAAAFLWLVVGTKLIDEVFRSSILTPAFRILYQPLPAGKRLRIQAVRESIIEPLALGLSGVLLLVLTSVLSLGTVRLLYIILALLAGCFAVGVLLRREYTVALVGALTKRRLRGVSLPLDDESTTAVLKKGLASPNAGEVIYCLSVLEESGHKGLEAALLELLSHPEASVRQHVLTRIRRSRVTAAMDRVGLLAGTDPSPVVCGQALRALCSLGETDVIDQVSEYIAHADPEVRKGAIVGLLQSCGIDGVLVGGVHFQSLMASPDPADRRLAAQILGEVGIKGFYQPLLRLLRDEDVEVRRRALEAAGRVKNVKLVPPMIEMLTAPEVRENAFWALVRFGDGVVPGLAAALARPDCPPAVRVRLAQVCGRVGGDAAVKLLREHVACPSPDVRGQVLSGLVACKFRSSEGEAAEIKRLISEEASGAAWALAAVADLGADEDAARLVASLLNEVRGHQERVLTLLSFVYPADSMLQAKAHLGSDSGERRASTIEMIDNLVAPDLKPLVLPLLDDVTPEQRLARLNPLFPQPRLGRADRLRNVVAPPGGRSSSWAKACALYLLGKTRAQGFDDCIVPALRDPAPVVRETAAWALHATGSDQFRQQVRELRDDPSQLVLGVAKRLEANLPTRVPGVAARGEPVGGRKE